MNKKIGLYRYRSRITNILKYFVIHRSLWIIIAVFLIGLNSCNKNDEVKPDTTNGGIAISFDDGHPTQWLTADSRLSGYHWKATFFMSYFDKLSSDGIGKLRELQKEGHEIAGHGLNHLNAIDYISTGKINEYLNIEISPMIDLMEEKGFTVQSFAYPFGQRNTETDRVLLNYFDILRGVAWGGNIPISSHSCFFNNTQIVFALGIDTHYTYFDGIDYEKYILDLLTYARDNNKILILYGHQIVEDITEDYQTNISTLELICNFVNENNMKFYTYTDLKKFIK